MNDTFRALLADNADHAATFADRFGDVQDGQHPDAVTVCCSDSRVLQDHVWGNDDPGHLFTVSNIGNRVRQRTAAGEVVSGDVLYPIAHTGTETAVVVGHTGCGAVTATYDVARADGGVDVETTTDPDEAGSTEPPGIAHCIDLLAPRLEPALSALPDGLDRAGTINRLVEYNVDRAVEALVESPHVPDAVDVAGVVYDFQDVYGDRRGEVQVINVDGETDPETLRTDHPDVADRVDRLWTY
jgi:carbonic anhydrase